MPAPYKLVMRHGVYQVHWTALDGVLHRKSTSSRDLKQAHQRAIQILAGQWQAPSAQARNLAAMKVTSENVTMAKVFDRCENVIWTPEKIKSIATVRSNVRILNRLIGHELVRDMTYQRLEKLVEELRGYGYAEATISRKMAAVSAALTQATRERDAQGNPWLTGRPAMPQVVVDNYQDRVLLPHEETALFNLLAEKEAAEPTRDWRRFALLIRFLLDTGARLGSALAVRQEDVRERLVDGVPHTFVTFGKNKSRVGENGKAYSLPLTAELVAVLPFLIQSAGKSGLLFPFKSANCWYRWNALRENLKAREVADITGVKLHTLRHTCITAKARRSGKRGDIFKIAKWANHANIAITTKRYGHLLADDLVELL